MADTTTTDGPLPLTRDLLDQFWMPPEPDTEVSRLTARANDLSARHATVTAALAGLHTADVATLVDTDDIDQALATLDANAITAALLQRRAAVLADAANQIRSRLDHATRTDPGYLAWRNQCQTVLTAWLDCQRFDAEPGERDAERRRRLELFAHQHGGG